MGGKGHIVYYCLMYVNNLCEQFSPLYFVLLLSVKISLSLSNN